MHAWGCRALAEVVDVKPCMNDRSPGGVDSVRRCQKRVPPGGELHLLGSRIQPPSGRMNLIKERTVLVLGAGAGASASFDLDQTSMASNQLVIDSRVRESDTSAPEAGVAPL